MQDVYICYINKYSKFESLPNIERNHFAETNRLC